MKKRLFLLYFQKRDVLKKITWNWVMFGLRHLLAGISSTFMTWMEWARALCLAPISRYNWVTARAVVKSLYSRYMLWVPLLESYLNQMAKFLILVGFLSNTFYFKMMLKNNLNWNKTKMNLLHHKRQFHHELSWYSSKIWWNTKICSWQQLSWSRRFSSEEAGCLALSRLEDVDQRL